MRIRLRTRILTLVLGLALGLGGTAAVAASKTPTNTGFAVHGSITSGQTTVFSAAEWSSQIDYNGDGDTYDHVLHVRDGVRGTTTNLGIAVSIMRFDGRFIAFLASEYGQGGSDLNGDGDTFDNVLHVHDLVTGVTRNLGIASGFQLSLSDGVVATSVPEFQQGFTDLNGDGDVADSVLYVHDGRRGTTTNMKLATFAPQVDAGTIAFGVSESQQGGTDLNGDGDALDTVMHVHTVATGATHNTAMAGMQVSGLAGGRVLFSASEYSQGKDLNGDGDTFDSVVHVYDAATKKLANVGVVSFYGSALEGGVAAIPVSEGGEGSDLNGDGDLYDNVLAVYDVASGKLTNLGLAALGAIEIEARRVAFTVNEYSQGPADLNGDGDTFDSVVHVHDVDTGKTTAVAAGSLVALIGSKCCLTVWEFGEGAADRNGDGDAFDRVLAVYDAASGKTKNHGLATSFLQAGTTHILVEGSEWYQGNQDLNGDGDTNDNVVHVLNMASGSLVNLGLAGRVGGFHGAGTSMVSFAVSELGEGTDLNGDGDTYDYVLHVVE